MPRELRDGVFDLAILGQDIAEEWRLAGFGLDKISDLEYGYANLVVAVPDTLNVRNLNSYLKRVSKKNIVRCDTEYPFITQDKIYKNKKYRELFNQGKPMIVSKFGKIGKNTRLIINDSYGATESAVNPKQSADFIVECSSSGKTLDENNLKAIDTLIESSAVLYTTEEALRDPWKNKKIDFIKTMLDGVVKARKTDYIVFNIPNKKKEQMLKYLRREKLYTKEPTITANEGNYLQIGIEILKSKWLNIAYGLKRHGADDIVRLDPSQIIK